MKIACCICVVAVVALAGCASTPKPAEPSIVYNPPPPPATFDLNMYLTAKYMHSSRPLRIAGQDYSFDGAIAYIKKHKAGVAGPYTVLLHGLNGGDVLVEAYMCFVALMHEAGAVGYTGSNGEKPSAPKMTIAANQYANLLHGCRTP